MNKTELIKKGTELEQITELSKIRQPYETWKEMILRYAYSEGKLFRELGEDGYFYNCSRLIIYVYDKTNVIRDVGNFIKALSRTQKDAGKDVVVYVNQTKELI